METQRATGFRIRSARANIYTNLKLWDAIQSIGYRTAREFCQDYKLPYHTVIAYLREESAHRPVTVTGEPTKTAEQLMVIFHRMYDDLFNIPCEEDLESRSEQQRRHAEAYVAEQGMLQCNSSTEWFDCVDLARTLYSAVEQLTAKEQYVICKRYGLTETEMTCREIGLVFDEVGEYNVCAGRINQIELKALRKLRHPSRSNRLVTFIGGLERPVQEALSPTPIDQSELRDTNAELRREYWELDVAIQRSQGGLKKLKEIHSAVNELDWVKFADERSSRHHLVCKSGTHIRMFGRLNSRRVIWCSMCGEILEMYDFKADNDATEYRHWLTHNHQKIDVFGYRLRIQAAIAHQESLSNHAQSRMQAIRKEYPWFVPR